MKNEVSEIDRLASTTVDQIVDKEDDDEVENQIDSSSVLPLMMPRHLQPPTTAATNNTVAAAMDSREYREALYGERHASEDEEAQEAPVDTRTEEE